MKSPIRSREHAIQVVGFKAAASLAVSFFWVAGCSPAYPPPPESRREPVADTLHGIEFIDPYRWLEDQESPETRAWIDAQNDYAETIIGQSPLRAELETRLAALMDAHDFGSPIRGGDYEYFWLRRKGTELPVIYRRPTPDSSVPLDPEAEHETIIDPHGWSPDNTVRAEIGSISHDGRYLIYRVRRGGQDEVEIRIRDLETGADLPDSLPNGLYSSISWNRDGSGFYYSARSRTSGARIRFHRLGTEISSDEELFGQGYGPDKFVGLRQVDGGRYFIYDVWHGWSRIEVYAQDMSNGGPITEIAGPQLDARFYPQFHAGKLYMLTNLDAPNNRIVAVDLERPRPDDWIEVIPESADPLQSFTFIDDKLYATYLHDVNPRIKSFELDGTPAGDLAVPELHTASIRGGGEGKAFLTLSSFTQPPIVYRIDLDSGERDVWTRRNVPFDPAGFEVKQIWYTSKDGTRIPMFLVHQAGLDLSGDHPTWLAGYGGFLAALTPRFDPMALAFVEHGGVYAMANLRGGSEFGERWHRAGMLENKQNVFDDFIAAAEWLIATGYTDPSRLAIRGYSNGGLLVAAALTQRPDLFRAVLCGFPDLDMVRFFTFTRTNNLPALHEYGNAAIPEQFEFLRRHSPYQNVKAGTDYPAVILTSGDLDTRVPPLQARKMTARLQAATSSGLPVVLRYDPQGGHAANRGRPFSKIVDDNAAELAFILQQIGVTAGTPGS